MVLEKIDLSKIKNEKIKNEKIKLIYCPDKGKCISVGIHAYEIKKLKENFTSNALRFIYSAIRQ